MDFKSYPGVVPDPVGFIPTKHLWVSPSEIKVCVHRPFIFRNKLNNAAILGGSWDENPPEFEKLIDFYPSFCEVVEGAGWESTRHYHRILKEISSGRHLWGCIDEISWRRYLEYQFSIYEDIKKNGYKDHHPNERVEVCLGRNGDLLFNDGRHRLSYAKKLGIEKIPVNVVAVHEDFVKNKNLGHFIDQDFYLFRRRKKILEKYFEFNWEEFKGASVYDVGPQRGVWSVASAQAGAKVEAIDIDEQFIHAFNKITRYHGFEIECSLGDFCAAPPKKIYDIVLFLGVWHHIPEKASCYRALDNVFAIAKNKIYLEGPVTTGTSTFEKHLDNGRTKYHAFYWVPNLDEMRAEITKRGGTIINTSLGENGSRAFFEVKVN